MRMAMKILAHWRGLARLYLSLVSMRQQLRQQVHSNYSFKADASGAA